jgi:hypothetical protein
MQTAINGNYYSFVNIELRFISTLLVVGIKSLNYKDDLTRKDVRGTASVQIGLTRGAYSASGDVEFYLNPRTTLLRILGPGWRQAQLSASVTYGPDDTGQLTTDVIPQFFLGEQSADQAESDDPLMRKFHLIIPTQILWDGMPSIFETSPQLAIG